MLLFYVICIAIGEDVLRKDKIILIIISFLICEIVLLFNLACETRIYYVGKKGIYVKWIKIITLAYDWSNFEYIGIEMVRTQGIINYDNEAIVCSTIPIKRKRDKIEECYFVDSDWIMFHSKKVFDIRISDFIEGQLEEFWNYVPEKFKQ